MKKILLVLLFAPAFLWAQESEKEAIKAVINSAYLEGITMEGNAEKIDAGFHPGFNILGYNANNDRVWEFPIYYWKPAAIKNASDGSNEERGPVRFEYPLIDVTGNAAIAKVEYYTNDELSFSDYLSLYKFQDGWKIVSKIYYKHPGE